MASEKTVSPPLMAGLWRECAWRIFCAPAFWVTTVLCAALKVADCYTASPFGIAENIYDGYSASAVYYLDMMDDTGILLYAVTCLSVLAGAGLFAEEAQGNALFMRTSRTGAARYAISRMTAATVGSFLCMLLSDILAAVAMVVVFHQGFLYAEIGAHSWTTSALLEAGRIIPYALIMLGRHALEAAFYAALTVGISSFLPNRKVIVAVPIVLRYLMWRFSNSLSEPFFVWSPRFVYGPAGVEAYYLGVPEGISFLFTLAYTLAAALLCGLLLWAMVRRREGV